MSFKEATLDLGPLDFTAQESFITAVFSYLVRLPLDDIWQDEAWRRRNQMAIIDAEAAPSVRSLSGSWLNQNSERAAQRGQLRFLSASHNVTGKGDTVFGSWFFIERLAISDINANVTVSLTSNIMAAAELFNAQGNDESLEEMGAGVVGWQLAHIIRSSGFQLINVSNVAIQLKGKRLESKLLNTNSIVALLQRHYFQQGLREAHKVLGGTGPAVAQIPLTVVWAGGTVFDLTRDLATRRVGALSIAPRVGFILFTAMSQLLGVTSKSMAAALAAIPYERSGELADAQLIQRYIVRPQNAVEAFGMAFKALAQGCAAAASGLVTDPMTGWRRQRAFGALCGVAKGVLGFGVRPIAGFAEWGSKCSQGAALVCLGRQGIQGRIMRRVYAPGTTRRMHEQQEDRSSEHLAIRRRVLAMWQDSLPLLSERLRCDAISDVLVTRTQRVCVFTDRHVVYCRAKYLQPGVATYRLRWVVPLAHINNVLGNEGKLVVSIRASVVLHMRFVGTWRIPVTKKIKTGNLETYERLATVLNNHVTSPGIVRHDALPEAMPSHDFTRLRITTAAAGQCTVTHADTGTLPEAGPSVARPASGR